LGIGPGDWLLFCPEADAPTLKARISAVPGCYAAEQGDALTFLDLGDAVDLIVRLTGLRADALAPGRTARTRIAGIAAIFHGTDDGVRMLFDRSYQRHVRDWLDAAV
jgi:sarcosine oxidase gamma subunit